MRRLPVGPCWGELRDREGIRSARLKSDRGEGEEREDKGGDAKPSGQEDHVIPPGKGGTERWKMRMPPFAKGRLAGKGGHWGVDSRVPGYGACHPARQGRGALDVGGEVPGAAWDARNDARAHLAAATGPGGPRATPRSRSTRRRRTVEPFGTAAATRPRPFQRSATSTCPSIPSPFWTVGTLVFSLSNTVLSTTVCSAGGIRAPFSNAPLSRDPPILDREPTSTNVPPLWQRAAARVERDASWGSDTSCDRAVRWHVRGSNDTCLGSEATNPKHRVPSGMRCSNLQLLFLVKHQTSHELGRSSEG